MKKIVVSALLVAFFATGCNNETTNTNNHTSGSKSVNTRIVSVRDQSINRSNAFNDLFLDSADVEKFIVSQKLSDTLAPALRSFYNTRNFEYAWFTSGGMIEQAMSFHSTYCTDKDCKAENKSLEKRLDKITGGTDSTTVIDAKDPAILKDELLITVRYLQYAMENYKGKNISPADLGTYIPAKKTTITGLADALLANNADNDTYASVNESFGKLREQLKKYRTIVNNGGWPAITASKKKYKLGVNDPAIAQIKKRLQVTGELTPNDTSTVFTPELENAVKAYQQTHGEKPTGIVTPALVKSMNIPAMARMQQLLVNMQRTRWMPANHENKVILVNIPEFELYVDSGKSTLFSMDVVVGAEGHNTTMFSGKLSQIVFSPYWNVPPSIVKKEILPSMARDKNYLEKKDMEIIGHDGDLPVVRQKPGNKNALGKVKFLFPNSFDIYLHDTPEKGLFKRNERSLSHGCIRLSDPVKMAYFLLQDSKVWPQQKIDSAMNSGDQQFVNIKNPVPVIITYYTSWVDNNGAVHFADDIYGHDKDMAAKMFIDAQDQTLAMGVESAHADNASRPAKQ